MLTYHLYTLSKPVIPNVFSRHIRDMWVAKVMLPQPISKFLLKNFLVIVVYSVKPLLSTGNCKIINLSEENILWGFKI